MVQLRIQCCHTCGVGQSYGLDLTPGPGTSICQGFRKKKKVLYKYSLRITKVRTVALLSDKRGSSDGFSHPSKHHAGCFVDIIELNPK